MEEKKYSKNGVKLTTGEYRLLNELNKREYTTMKELEENLCLKESYIRNLICRINKIYRKNIYIKHRTKIGYEALYY